MQTPVMEAELPDLKGALLTDLPELAAQLKLDVDRVMEQVAKPRVNLGSSGPPGRAD